MSIFVNKCAICRKPSESAVCDSCRSRISRTRLGACHGCGKSPKNCICKKRRPFVRCVSLYEYQVKGVSHLIYKLKTTGNKKLVSFLADSMVALIQNEYHDISFDAVTYVPTSFFKKKLKGFDHAELLAKEIAERLQIECVAPPIKRNNRLNQKFIARSKRMENAKAAFSPRKKIKIKGSVLLVDDVMTVGATLNECAKVLLKAGADSVYTVTFAITCKK